MPDQLDINKLEDKELISLILQDQDNFAYLMNRYEAKLSRYIRRISGLRAEDAEDILQDVFIKTYQNINSFDKSLKFSSWIYRIAHNEVISNWRKKKARPEEATWDVTDLLNNLADDTDMSKNIDIEYLRKNIDTILASMDMKYREVLILKFLEEKDYREISDILKKPMGTVATLISRAKKQFGQKIAELDIKL